MTKTSKEIDAILKPYTDDVKRHIVELAKKSKADIKRYTGALSEEFKGQVKAVAEQHRDLKKDITEVKKTLESHTEMIGTLLVDMTVVKGDVRSIKESLKTKVSRKRFVELERRVLAE
jgi:uncharacterized protein YwgA